MTQDEMHQLEVECTTSPTKESEAPGQSEEKQHVFEVERKIAVRLSGLLSIHPKLFVEAIALKNGGFLVMASIEGVFLEDPIVEVAIDCDPHSEDAPLILKLWDNDIIEYPDCSEGNLGVMEWKISEFLRHFLFPQDVH